MSLKKQVNRLGTKVVRLEMGAKERMTGISQPPMVRSMGKMTKDEEWHHRRLGHAEYGGRCGVSVTERNKQAQW